MDIVHCLSTLRCVLFFLLLLPVLCICWMLASPCQRSWRARPHELKYTLVVVAAMLLKRLTFDGLMAWCWRPPGVAQLWWQWWRMMWVKESRSTLCKHSTKWTRPFSVRGTWVVGGVCVENRNVCAHHRQIGRRRILIPTQKKEEKKNIKLGHFSPVVQMPRRTDNHFWSETFAVLCYFFLDSLSLSFSLFRWFCCCCWSRWQHQPVTNSTLHQTAHGEPPQSHLVAGSYLPSGRHQCRIPYTAFISSTLALLWSCVITHSATQLNHL